ncbi:MAG: ferrochelatase [Gemmatimonadota bacterium]|nr:ferrochelatase [Gemmatimonadota bacterium]
MKAVDSPVLRRGLDPEKTTGLILAGMGGPDGPDSVKPFLTNLFRDPAVLPMPAPIARAVGAWLVHRRASEVRERYGALGFGGGSPQVESTRAQSAEMARLLGERGFAVLPSVAMRYWHPFAEEAVEALLREGAGQFVVIPTYPQYASATTGTVFASLTRAMARLAPAATVHRIDDWHLLPGYVEALAARAEQAVRRLAEAGSPPEECALLYSAHSLPERFIRAGDPYLSQTRATVARVHDSLRRRLADAGDWFETMPGGGREMLAFQSEVGPVRWIGPSLIEETRRLGEAGCGSLAVVPVSFACEHIETLMELDVELAEEAAEAGIRDFVRTPALGMDPGWLQSMADLVEERLFASRGARRAADPGRTAHA